MNFKTTPRKLIIVFVISVFITIASFRFVFPVGAINFGKGELYNLTNLTPFVLAYFLIIFAAVFLISSLLERRKN